jgi:exonuclease III
MKMSESHTEHLLEKITLVSYNCHGFNKYKAPYLGNLMEKCSFLFVQEHWLCDAQISTLNCNNNSFMVHGVSGFDNNQVLHGRPFGGTAILWHKNFDATVKAVQTDSSRISAVVVTAKDINVLLINVYMPVDDGSIDKYDIFVNEMYKIQHLIEIHSQYLPVVGGDFNVDLNRDSLHSRFFSEFLLTHRLCCADVIKKPYYRLYI